MHQRREIPTVLICDDNDLVRAFIREVVTGLGAQTLETQDGLEALRLAALHRPNAIVLDVVMYGCSGLEVLERLKGDPLLAAIPVILATGSRPVLSDSYLPEYGADKVLAKPFSAQELSDALEDVLAGAEQQD